MVKRRSHLYIYCLSHSVVFAQRQQVTIVLSRKEDSIRRKQCLTITLTYCNRIYCTVIAVKIKCFGLISISAHWIDMGKQKASQEHKWPKRHC